jgi:hypothetical protein
MRLARIGQNFFHRNAYGKPDTLPGSRPSWEPDALKMVALDF